MKNIIHSCVFSTIMAFGSFIYAEDTASKEIPEPVKTECPDCTDDQCCTDQEPAAKTAVSTEQNS